MTRDQFDNFCGGLTATTHVIQWGNASVWKVGGKIFAVCSNWGAGKGQKIAFKCGDMSYALLREQAGIVPAPYLARAKWVQLETAKAMSNKDIKLYVQEAHKIVAAKLTKAKRAELGL